jgi:NAD(P)-dependent dehydrogenase (short-subunit alcohol dehydrogenase family)
LNIFSLKGKKILITGASSGIGKQIAITLAEYGASLTLLGRDANRLNEVIDSLPENSHRKFSIDITDSIALTELVNNFVESFDGIVFNAGIVEYLPIKFIKTDTIQKIFNINFNANVLLSQQLIKSKKINQNGSIVFISSLSSKLGVAGTALYASSKAALNTYSKVLATELAPKGVRSNCICPGIVRTSVIDQLKQLLSVSILEDSERSYPLGYNDPIDIAALVIYLLSDASKRMTGSELIIDGGYSLI